jgi:hypothetical protein
MQCDKQCKAAIDRFVSKKENELITGGRIGDFYKYVNNKIVSKSGVGILKNDTGETVIEDADKAELLNKFFSSVFTVDNNIIPLLPTTVDLPKTLGEVNFSFDKVLKVLRGLKAKHTVGPDGLTTFFLKNVSGSLAFPLMLVFNQSFQSGKLPSIWKHAIVTPVFKKRFV